MNTRRRRRLVGEASCGLGGELWVGMRGTVYHAEEDGRAEEGRALLVVGARSVDRHRRRHHYRSSSGSGAEVPLAGGPGMAPVATAMDNFVVAARRAVWSFRNGCCYAFRYRLILVVAAVVPICRCRCDHRRDRRRHHRRRRRCRHCRRHPLRPLRRRCRHRHSTSV